MAHLQRWAVRRPGSGWIGGIVLIGALTLFLPPAPAQESDPGAEAEEEPRRTDLVEHTKRRLIQLDVTVLGKREALVDLTAEDFELSVNGHAIESFLLDNLCKLPDEGPVIVEEVVEHEGIVTPATPAARPPRARTAFLFYYDQHHLTMEGRQRSLDITRQLIPKLIVDGNEGMIISAGQTLESFSVLTGDQQQLLDAIGRIERDRLQWDPWVALEDSRIREVVDQLNDYDTTQAMATARLYQREEVWRTQKALHLFSMVLGRLTELNPPKAVVYFADTMRSNAGAHYMSFFSSRVDRTDGASNVGAFDAGHAFDRVVEEATALGIRIYTIQAQGLVTEPVGTRVTTTTGSGGSHPLANSRRIKHAQDSLVGLAAESGGRAFLNGVSATRIAAQIQQDLSCVYLLSFDGSHLRDNGSYRVVVRSKRRGVDTRVRGRITVQSESRRLTSRLLAAFATPESRKSEFPVRGLVIPTGFSKGKYSALVQLFVPASPLPATSWDLGLSLISHGEVAEEVSGHIQLTGPGIPVVLETEMRFSPGAVRLVAVAHETTGNSISTDEVELSWPDPNDAEVTLGPFVVMQPGTAAILRDEDLRRSGAVAVREDQPAKAGLPTAMIGIVCRGKSKKGKLRIERKLVGEAGSFAPFGDMVLDLSDDRCAQIRDFIPAGSMSSGVFRYEVRVLRKDVELASTVRLFSAVSDEEFPAATPASVAH